MDAVEIGGDYVCEYPASNYEGVKLRYEVRRFRVLGIRDLQIEPLKAGTIERDPLIRRRGNLAIVWDHDCQDERRFYLGAMRKLRGLDPGEIQIRYRVIRLDNYAISVDSTDENGAKVICGLANIERPFVIAVPFALPDYRLAGLPRHLAS